MAKTLKKKEETQIEKEVAAVLEAEELLKEVPDILGCDMNYDTSGVELKAYLSDETSYIRIKEGLRAEILEDGPISLEDAVLLWLLRESGCIHDLFSVSEQNRVEERMTEAAVQDEKYRALWEAEFHNVFEGFMNRFVKTKSKLLKNPYLEGVNLVFPYLDRRKSVFIDMVIFGTNVADRRAAAVEYLKKKGFAVEEIRVGSETGYYEGSSTQGKGKYLVAGITAADLFGNEIFYYNSQCESYGYYQPENSIRKDLSDLSVSLGISEDDIPQETEKQTESEREPIAKPRKTDVFVNKRSPETSEYDYAVVIDKVVYQYRMETDDYAVVAFDENNGNMEDGRKVKVRAEILGRPVTEVTLHGEFDPPQGRVHLILPESVRKIQIDECTFKAITFPSTFTKKNSKSIVSECTIGKIYLAGKSVYTGNIYQISGLKTIKLPSKLKYIKAGFLKGSTDLEKISIPNQVRTIGKEAFAGCRNLKIYIPATVKNIGKNAFGKGDGCVKKIYCVKNSAAYKYAKKNNIPYKTVSIKE